MRYGAPIYSPPDLHEQAVSLAAGALAVVNGGHRLERASLKPRATLDWQPRAGSTLVETLKVCLVGAASTAARASWAGDLVLTSDAADDLAGLLEHHGETPGPDAREHDAVRSGARAAEAFVRLHEATIAALAAQLMQAGYIDHGAARAALWRHPRARTRPAPSPRLARLEAAFGAPAPRHSSRPED